MKQKKTIAAVLAALALAAGLWAQTRATMAPEKGTLRVLLSGTKVATEEFSISQSGGVWTATGNVQIAAPDGASAKVTGRMQLDAEGLPKRYEWSMEAAGAKRSGSVQFDGGTASIEVRMDDSAPFTEQFFFETPRVVILDNNLYHHYAILARLYDMKVKGTQTFWVYIPQDRTPGTITVESVGTQDTANGKLEHLRVRTADVEIDLYVGKNGLVQLAVPSANVVVEHQ